MSAPTQNLSGTSRARSKSDAAVPSKRQAVLYGPYYGLAGTDGPSRMPMPVPQRHHSHAASLELSQHPHSIQVDQCSFDSAPTEETRFALGTLEQAMSSETSLVDYPYGVLPAAQPSPIFPRIQEPRPAPMAHKRSLSSPSPPLQRAKSLTRIRRLLSFGSPSTPHTPLPLPKILPLPITASLDMDFACVGEDCERRRRIVFSDP
jgi:hypothetical protein